MKLIDFRTALRVLNLPHPLLSDDVDLEGVARRVVSNVKKSSAPHEHDHRQTEGHHRPKNFQAQVSENGLWPFVFGTPAVFDDKGNDQNTDECRKKSGDGEEKIQKSTRAPRHGGRLSGNEWESYHGIRRSPYTPGCWIVHAVT